MNDHRFHAHATIRPGEHELRVDDSPLQLVRVMLVGDGGTVAAADGTEHQRPDVICQLRPTQARQLAAQLLALATQAEGLERTTR